MDRMHNRLCRHCGAEFRTLNSIFTDCCQRCAVDGHKIESDSMASCTVCLRALEEDLLGVPVPNVTTHTTTGRTPEIFARQRPMFPEFLYCHH